MRTDKMFIECMKLLTGALIVLALCYIGHQQYVANHIAEYDIATIHGDACTPNSTIPHGALPGIDGVAPQPPQSF